MYINLLFLSVLSISTMTTPWVQKMLLK